jgi:hypothetical protein
MAVLAVARTGAGQDDQVGIGLAGGGDDCLG